MNHLRSLNVEKSLSVLRDFCGAAAAGEPGPGFMEKKAMAEKALDHLDRIYRQKGNDTPDKPMACPDCTNSQRSK